MKRGFRDVFVLFILCVGHAWCSVLLSRLWGNAVGTSFSLYALVLLHGVPNGLLFAVLGIVIALVTGSRRAVVLAFLYGIMFNLVGIQFHQVCAAGQRAVIILFYLLPPCAVFAGLPARRWGGASV